MPSIPAKLDVPLAALQRFQVAFKNFAKSERDRLNRDKAILTSWKTVSDLDQLVDAISDTAVGLANQELNNILQGTP